MARQSQSRISLSRYISIHHCMHHGHSILHQLWFLYRGNKIIDFDANHILQPTTNMSFITLRTLVEELQTHSRHIPELNDISLRHITLVFALCSRLFDQLVISEQLAKKLPPHVLKFFALSLGFTEVAITALWEIMNHVCSVDDFQSSEYYVSHTILDNLFRFHGADIPGIGENLLNHSFISISH